MRTTAVRQKSLGSCVLYGGLRPARSNNKFLRKQHGVVILDTKEVVSLLDVE